MAQECFDEAATLLEHHLTNEPLSNKGLLGWTRVQCAQGNSYLAVERLTSPIKQFPENPYYKLACVEIRLAENEIPTKELITSYQEIEQCADSDSAADMFAKLGHSAALQGLWSVALPYFLKAITLCALADPTNQPENLILLYKRNEPSLHQFLSQVVVMDHRGNSHKLSHMPLEILGRVICILITARELGIPEASPLINYIAVKHPQLQNCEYRDLVNIAIRYSPGWIGLQLPYEFSQPIILWN